MDLARLAGLAPAGVICEIMNDDGTMARVPQLEEFCARHGLKMISVADLIRYRMKHERFIRRVGGRLRRDRVRRVPTHRLRQRFRPRVPPGAGPRRGGRRGARAGADARPLPVRRRVRLDHLRVRPTDPRTRCGAIAAEGAGVLVYLHETGPGFRLERDRLRRRPHGHPRPRFHALSRGSRPAAACSTSTASARRFSPTWACTPSGC